MHYRKIIREAMANFLIGKTPAMDRVFKSRSIPVFEDQMPALKFILLVKKFLQHFNLLLTLIILQHSMIQMRLTMEPDFRRWKIQPF